MARGWRAAAPHDGRQLTLAAVERQRTHLWVVAALFIIAASAGVGVALSDGQMNLGESPTLRWAFLGLAGAFLLYAIEQEVSLRRVTRALLESEIVTSSLRTRVEDLTVLSRAGREVSAGLDLERVLDVTLAGAAELTGATTVSVWLHEEDTWALARHRGVAGPAAPDESLLHAGEPVLTTAADGSALLAVPLAAEGAVLGVVQALHGRSDQRPTEVTLPSVAIFARQAATAMVNARNFADQRAQARRLADALERRSELVATLIHELKTPLTAVVGLSHLLTEPRARLDAAQRTDMVATVREQADRLNGMVGEVLKVASADAGADLRRAPVHLGEVVDTVVRQAHALTAARRGGDRDISVTVADGLPAVLGDADALGRVCSNLLENAVKYTPDGSAVNVSVRHVRRGDRVVLQVTDRGPGIPPEELPHIFDRFRRSSSGTADGVGLGLYIVRTLVAAHGGEVHVDSVVGHGTTFTVTLPAGAAPAAPTPQLAGELA